MGIYLDCLPILLGLAVIYSRVEGSCPDGYCRHSGGCYLTLGLNESWIDARSYCSILGGSFLSITSSAQQIAVEGALRRTKGLIYPGNFWLDITDLLNPKDWKTMSRRSSISYSNWQPWGSDNDTSSGNCVYMSETHDYQWKVAPCNRKMNFVCYSSGSRRSYSYYSYDDDVEC